MYEEKKLGHAKALFQAWLLFKEVEENTKNYKLWGNKHSHYNCQNPVKREKNTFLF